MTECDYCGASDGFLFTCDVCGGEYCGRHRSSDSHTCFSPLDDRESGDDLDSVSLETIFGVSETPVQESDGRSTGPGGGSRIGRRITRVLPSVRQALLVVIIIGLFAGVGGVWYYSGWIFPSYGDTLQSDIGIGSGNAGALNQTAVERSVHSHMNEERLRRNIDPIEYDPRLAAVAASHSEDMGRHNYTSHVSLDGETVEDRYDQFGVACDEVGEIILFTYVFRDISTPNGTVRYENEDELSRGIVASWMRSNEHRQVLLKESWNRTGIGIAITDSNKVYITQNFC